MVPIPIHFPLFKEEGEVDAQVADLKEPRKCTIVSDRYRSVVILHLYAKIGFRRTYLYIGLSMGSD
jgi:hypothetical protein